MLFVFKKRMIRVVRCVLEYISYLYQKALFLYICFIYRYYDQGLDWYRHQMPYSLENQITVEKTPNYFVDWEVPERIYNFNSSIKLILIVRNPIDRAVSDYVQLKVKKFS